MHTSLMKAKVCQIRDITESFQITATTKKSRKVRIKPVRNIQTSHHKSQKIPLRVKRERWVPLNNEKTDDRTYISFTKKLDTKQNKIC